MTYTDAGLGVFTASELPVVPAVANLVALVAREIATLYRMRGPIVAKCELVR